MKEFVCFDVESVGLHGPAFSVGAVHVLDGVDLREVARGQAIISRAMGLLPKEESQ